MPEKFLKPYDPQATEAATYKRWEDSGFFNPDTLPGERPEPFSIVLPPPNVTGTLHLGHAAMLAVEDIIVRYKRMKGFKTLWLPGTDHAAIATQSKVEKEIQKKEDKSRHDLGREEFLKRVEAFAKESHDTIVNQVRRMGASVDWSREAYTLDEPRRKAVNEAFKRMYEAGLIYRAARIVNWDPKGQTTVSDDEVEHEETPGMLYTFRYAKDFPIPIATTRPETKVGDTAVAVHPDDARYAQYIGKTFEVEFAGATLSIRIVGDEAVDPQFGTGAVGVTPAHSHTDWEIAQRHGLPLVQVINEYARMTDAAGPLVAGKKVAEARAAVVAWLTENGLLEKEEKTTLNLSKAERTGGTIEPLPKLQWWIAVNKEFAIPHSDIPGIPSGSKTTLKEVMRKAVENGSVHITPDRFEKTYFHWIDNLRDWCISRQIWFGHRIPVWYKGEEIAIGEAPTGEGWEQDPDTLDTWFSSGLWTFSTLGWPEETADLKTFHPTALLETGYDILFFWVARMVLMTGFLLGTVPFRNVYLHGLVRDEKGRKMSKSIGNIIDPLDMIGKYGADAVRLSLIMGAAPGNDIKLSEDRIRGYKNFANKIWNIARFVLENTEDIDFVLKGEDPFIRDVEGLYWADVYKVTKNVEKYFEEFRLDLAAEEIYQYVWHTFADKIIEESKIVLKGNDLDAKKRVQHNLYAILYQSLKLLHPFMPFVTEEIWSSLPMKKSELLMVEPWPEN